MRERLWNGSKVAHTSNPIMHSSLRSNTLACADSLDLSGNTVGFLGAKALAEMPLSCKHVVELRISKCGISDASGVLIAAALESCKGLNL